MYLARTEASMFSSQDTALRDRLVTLRQQIAALHASNDPINDTELDDMIGLRTGATEPNMSIGELLVKYGQHRLYPADLPYTIIRDLFRRLRPSPATPVVDLGSGYGRIAFYGTLLDDIPVHGIELIPERVHEARRVQTALGLNCVSFLCGDASTTPWPEARHFCVMNSFSRDILPRVAKRLAHVAQKHRIIIASISTANMMFERSSWLQEIALSQGRDMEIFGVRLFTSRYSRFAHFDNDF